MATFFDADLICVTKVATCFAFADVTPANITLRRVFMAMPEFSLPVNRIIEIADAIGNEGLPTDFDQRCDALRQALTSLVRKGVLRSGTREGTRHYEANY